MGNDSLAPGVNAIHPGADDNASGTALVLELARRFARKGAIYPRAILFASWGAEELGLLGSKVLGEIADRSLGIVSWRT